MVLGRVQGQFFQEMSDWAGVEAHRSDPAAFRLGYREPTRGMTLAVRGFGVLAHDLDSGDLRQLASRWATAGRDYVRAVDSVNHAILNRDEDRRRSAMTQLEAAAAALAKLAGPAPEIEIVK